MADDSSPAPNTAVVVRERTILPVVDAVDVLDTSRFEHMQRVATVMASSSLIPESLRATKQGSEMIPLPPQTVIANCFLVVNQAVRWGMDPFAVAQATSVVHGRLMYEGKLVAAVLEARLGVRLSYDFDDAPGEKLGVTVRGLLPGDTAERTVEGTVADWKTAGDKSPWARPANHKRQLRYRGAREWARAHAPGIMLGVITDDEIDELVERREDMARIAPEPPITAALPGGPKNRRRRPESPEPSQDSGETDQGQTDGAHGGGDFAETAHDAEFEDRPTPAPEAGEPAEPSSETQAQGVVANPGDTIHVGVDAEGRTTMAVETRAPRDEVYTINGDVPDADGRLPTYKNGKPFSTVKATAKAIPTAYDLHAFTDAEEAGEGFQPPEESEDPSPPTSSGSQESEFDEVEEEPPPSLLMAAAIKMGSAPNYLAAKQVLKTLAATPEWKAASKDVQALVRRALWDRYEALYDAGEKMEPSEDFLLMRCFLEYGAATIADVDRVWPAFWRGPAYRNATAQDQQAIATLMMETKQRLAA